MGTVALVGVTDARGWLLLQERDEHAPVDANKWSLVGGGVEAGETPAAAARRELAEETGIERDDLHHLGHFVVPCDFHGIDDVDLFVVETRLEDNDITCNEGRQIVFVDPSGLAGLDLTSITRALYQRVLSDR